MTQPQALYALLAGTLGAATTAVGGASHDDSIRNVGIVTVAAAALAFFGGKLASWLADRAFKKFESIEAIPASIEAMRSEMNSQFGSMRTDMQTIAGNLATHTEVDAQWKQFAAERDAEMRRRLNALESAQGWTVRGKDSTSG